MRIKIKDKPRFCLGIINCILGILCVITLIVGRSSSREITSIAMVVCLLTGMGSIIDSVEKR